MTDFIVRNYFYILVLIPILFLIFYYKNIKNIFKRDIKISQRDDTEADILKKYNNIDIQSFHGTLEELINLNPFLTVNVNQNLLNGNKNVNAKSFIESNTWWILIDAYRNKEEGKLFFAIFVINKLPVSNPVFFSNVIKEINLISNSKINISIYRDID